LITQARLQQMVQQAVRGLPPSFEDGWPWTDIGRQAGRRRAAAGKEPDAARAWLACGCERRPVARGSASCQVPSWFTLSSIGKARGRRRGAGWAWRWAARAPLTRRISP